MFSAGLPVGFFIGARPFVGHTEDHSGKAPGYVESQRCLAAVVVAILLL
jgi:hypothetical protein